MNISKNSIDGEEEEDTGDNKFSIIEKSPKERFYRVFLIFISLLIPSFFFNNFPVQ